MFCTFWLGNVLRATTACTFSTSQLPKVLRDPGVLYLFTWTSLLCFASVHIVGSLTSKLPSIIFDNYNLGSIPISSPYHIYIYTISIIKTYILTQLDVWWLMILHCSTCFSLMTQVTSPNAPRATRLCRCPALCPSSARRGASPAAPGADPVNTASSSFIKRWFLGNTYGFTIYLYIYIYIYIYKTKIYNLWI